MIMPKMSNDCYEADLDSFDLIRRVKKMMIASWPELADEPIERRGRLVLTASEI